MKAITNKGSFYRKLTCWVVTFALAFSLFATPAYAAGVELVSGEVAPVEVEPAATKAPTTTTEEITPAETVTDQADEAPAVDTKTSEAEDPDQATDLAEAADPDTEEAEAGEAEAEEGEGTEDVVPAALAPAEDPEEGEGQTQDPLEGEENPGQPEEEPQPEYFAFPMVSAYLVKAAGNTNEGVAEAGDTINYNFEVYDLDPVAYAGTRVSDQRIGWNDLALDGIEGHLYFEGSNYYQVSGSYTVTEADVRIGEVIDNAFTVVLPDRTERTFAPGFETKEFVDTRISDYSVSLNGTYDPSNNVVTFEIAIENTGDLDLNGLQIQPSFDLPGEFSFFDDATGTVNVPAGSDPIVVHAEYKLTELDYSENLTPVLTSTVVVTDGDKAVTASCSTNVYAELETAYEIGWTTAISGSPDGVHAVPGSMVAFTFTVTNTGTADLTEVKALPLDSRFIPEGTWEAVEGLMPQQSVTFTGYIDVTEDDVVVNDEEDVCGIITAHVQFIVNGEDYDQTTFEGAKVASMYPYIINYYLDEGTGDKPELLDSVEGEAACFSLIDLEEGDEKGQLNYLMPKGYVAKAEPLKMTSDPDQNVIDVTFVKGDFPYYINYYADSVAPENIIKSDVLGGEAQFESTVSLSAAALNEYCPVGYMLLPVEESPTVTISTDEASNVIDVVYQRDTFGYTINYYVDSTENEPLVTVTGEATFGNIVTVTEGYFTGQLNYKLPTGYQPLDKAIELEIGAVQSQNVIDVVYSEKQSYRYSVQYYAGSKDAPLGTLTMGEAPYGETMQLSLNQLNALLPEEGYEAVTIDDVANARITITENVDQNVYEVIYAPQDFEYAINYFMDSDSSPFNILGSEEGIAPYDTQVDIDADLINKYLPEGFVAKSEGVEGAIRISADESSNVYNVVYDRDQFDICVNFYRDSVSEDNLIGSYPGKQYYGKNVVVDKRTLDYHCPEGYQSFDDARYITVTTDPAQNVIDVVYQKQTNLPYKVYFYKDSVSSGNYLGTEEGYGTFGDPIAFTEGRYAPVGYQTTGTIDPTFTVSDTITVSPDKNRVYVIYQKQTNIAYTVRYYKDSVSEENQIHEMSGTGAYQDNIPYDAATYLPEGYTLDHLALSGALVIGPSAEGNVLNVVYSKQVNLSYTVNYYAGSTDGQLLGTQIGYGTYDDPIRYNEALYIDQALGYTLPAQVSGATTIGATPEQSVMNIVYPAAKFGYTVNYYKDSIAEENLLGTDEGKASFLENIPYIDGKFLPVGYAMPGITSGGSISYDEASNVMNVVYQPARFSYTINYYRGSVSPNNLITSTVSSGRPFGSTVSISAQEMNTKVPAGYVPITESVQVTITEIPRNNVVNVVFEPNFTAFYNAGVASLHATYTGSSHYVRPTGVVPGDIITYTYNGQTQTRVVGSDANIGAEFKDVTNGELPVLVTLTRAGITSDPVQTTVYIAPAAVVPGQIDSGNLGGNPGHGHTTLPTIPDDSFATITPSAIEGPAGNGSTNQNLPTQSGDTAPSNNQTTPGNTFLTPATVLPTLMEWINPEIAVPQPTYDAQLADITSENGSYEPVSDEKTILDDTNPLAMSPFLTQGIGSEHSGVIGYLLLILAMICLAGAIIMMLMRKRIIMESAGVKGSERALQTVRIRRKLEYAALLGAAALIFYILWVILRI